MSALGTGVGETNPLDALAKSGQGGALKALQQQASQLRAKGFTVHITVEKGQSHVIGTLTGEGAARLFQEIEQAHQGCAK